MRPNGLHAATVRMAYAAAFLFCLPPRSPAVTQEVSVVCSSGNWVSNATYATVYTVADPGAGPVASGGSYIHYPGFIGAIALRPDLTNPSGVPREFSPDNDGDGLTDLDELTGAAFGGHATTDINKADTDGDGMSDADESRLMFDPNDPNHALRFVSVTRDGNDVVLAWIGRGGGTTNRVVAGAEIAGGAFTKLIHAAVYTGGDAPWHKITNSIVDTNAPATPRYYQLRIRPE